MPNAIVSTQDLSAIFTQVSNQFGQIKFDESTVAEKLAYFHDGMGQSVKLPWSPVTNAEKDWNFGTPRDKADAQAFFVEVLHKRKSAGGEQIYIDTLTQDVYKVLAKKMASIVSRAKKTYDRELAITIGANATGYDGVAFYATNHPVNPNDAALGTFSNLLAGTTLNEAGLVSALDALMNIKGWDGEILNASMGKIYLVVPNQRLFNEASKLINGTLIPMAGTAANTSVAASNQLTGRCEVVLFPELNTQGATPTKAWYLVHDTGNQKPFVVSVARKPTFYYSGLDPNEEVRVNFGAINYGYDHYFGCALGMPQLSVKAIEP